MDDVESRATAAADVLKAYLQSEQTLGSQREAFFCSPVAVPGRFHNLIDWSISGNYFLQKVQPPALPEWFKFGVDLKATNGFGAQLTSTWFYWLKRMPDATFKIFWYCHDEECEHTEIGQAIFLGSQDATVKALCGFPGAKEFPPTKERR